MIDASINRTCCCEINVKIGIGLRICYVACLIVGADWVVERFNVVHVEIGDRVSHKTKDKHC